MKSKAVPQRETYVSVDIETNGKIPGQNSMLSFAAVAFSDDGKEIGKFSANLELLDGAREDPKTMAWWATQPKAWKACRKNLTHPIIAMHQFVYWVSRLPDVPVCIAYPTSFDFMFLYWYMIAFTGESPFGFSALDIHSYSMGKLNLPFYASSRSKMPKRWFKNLGLHSHIALDDARYQGRLFMNMLRDKK